MDWIKSLGQKPDAKRRQYFSTLKNYKNGQFQNIMDTPSLAEGESMTKLLLQFFKKFPDVVPQQPIPFVLSDLRALSPSESVMFWFGHSSYFLQVDGLRILVDPVFSGNVSPIAHSVVAFPGSNHYQVSDLPNIDLLLISHDHWDHLDYNTIEALKGKVGLVICPLGVKQHFEYWGWGNEKVIEKNWYDSVEIAAGFTLTLTPARHFSGRLFRRNISLWTSYVLQTPSLRLFLGGDSGFGDHFEKIGQQFGPFDWAILECGQYDKKWPYIHSMPTQIIEEVKLLRAKKFLPVHHSKFKLAQHPWYEPLEKISHLANENFISIATPMIGEKIELLNPNQQWRDWWTDIR